MQSANPLIIHHQGRYFSKFALFMGTLMVVAAGILVLFNMFWGLALLPLGLFFFIPTQQFELDPDKKRFRDCTKIGPLSLGKWKELNDLKYLSITRVDYTYMRSTGLMAMDAKEELEQSFSLRFHTINNQEIEIDESDNKAFLTELGYRIAKSLRTKLIDGSLVPPKVVFEPKEI